MDNIRKEFISEIMKTLKIEGAFNIGTISDEMQHIPNTDLRAFHKALFGTDHSYLNGMDRIIKVAEQFKPVNVDLVEVKAKELISMVESINTKIGEDAKQRGEGFEYLVSVVKLPGVCEDDMAILDSIERYRGHKKLIINIRVGWNSKEQLEEFKRAILFTQSDSNFKLNTGIKKCLAKIT